MTDTCSNAQTQTENDFNQFLDTLDLSIEKFLNGDAELFLELWAKSDDITIAGGFGGPIEKGWNSIGTRLKKVDAVYSHADFQTERIETKVKGNLGYLIQHEQITFSSDKNDEQLVRNYRITMIFEKWEDGWKIIHRHADPNMEWKSP
ncbi:MAG: nuclear transport factor 2 family protein [Melioribacteraceae bacterium]|nr:nuclear transport factor 2 family protein [Melioribacteraceae bacterium]